MSEKRIESLDLNLIVALHWLLTERNVTAAAKKMSLSQPAMSRTLGRLREVFDDPLLVKSGASMILTRHAERLQPTVALAVDKCRDVFRTTESFDPALAQGNFRVACVDYAGVLIARAWHEFVRPSAPLINLEIVGVAVEIARDLVSGKVDLVFMPDPSMLVLPPGLDIDQFVRKLAIPQHYQCAVRKGHPAAKGKMTLKKFAGLEHILVAPEGTRQGVVDRQLAAAGLERRISYLTSTFLAALPVLQTTDCIITAPNGLLLQDADKLALFPPPVELSRIDIFAGWHPNWTHDARHQWIRNKLFDAFTALYGG